MASLRDPIRAAIDRRPGPFIAGQKGEKNIWPLVPRDGHEQRKAELPAASRDPMQKREFQWLTL
jgi:hypothetical protein